MKSISEELERKLICAVQEGMRNAFTGTNESEDFRIGAAVLTKKGMIYSSGQYCSDTFSLTLHAEQAALAHAAAHGDYEIAAIAIMGNEAAEAANSSKPIYPCHMCKQLLWESHLRSGLNTEIILVNKDGQIFERLTLLDILNYTWPKI